MACSAPRESRGRMTISSRSRESAHGVENRASRINGTHFQEQQSPSQTAKLCRVSQSAINVACSVWEGGNGEGLESTSPVPYFIREGGVGNVPNSDESGS